MPSSPAINGMPYGHMVFHGGLRLLKIYLYGTDSPGIPETGLLHTLPCHDAGIGDEFIKNAAVPVQADYVKAAKAKPYTGYLVEKPEGEATGVSFHTPTDPDTKFSIGGANSHLENTEISPQEGWEHGDGHLFVQEHDLKTVIIPFIKRVHEMGGLVKMDISYP